MKYKYTATQERGEVVESELDAKTVPEVLAFLTSRGLKPVSVKKIDEGFLKIFKMSLGSGKITVADQIFLSKYLALMHRIGTNLLQAINILIEDFKKSSIREFLTQVRTNLERGQPFYLAFANQPRTFSQVYINLVKAGEASGNLEEVFQNLTDSLTKEKKLTDQVKGALTYPIILLVTSFVILFFLIMFALPKIAKVFLDGGFQPPLFSRIIFGVGLFFGNFGGYIFVALILSGIVLTYLYKASFTFKTFVFDIVRGIPVVKEVVRKIALQRFAATLSSLVKAGMPLVQSLEITADAVGNVELHSALMRIAHEGISKGLTVGEAFSREPFFPQTVVNLISISERAGHIEEVLQTLAEFYAGDVDGSLKTMVSFLEPILLLFIGSVVGAIALSVIIPIYQLTSQF